MSKPINFKIYIRGIISLCEYLSLRLFSSYYSRILVRLLNYEKEDNGIYSLYSEHHWNSTVCRMLSATPSHLEDILSPGEQFPSPKPEMYSIDLYIIFIKWQFFWQLKQGIIFDIQCCILNDIVIFLQARLRCIHNQSQTINNDHKKRKDVIMIFENNHYYFLTCLP